MKFVDTKQPVDFEKKFTVELTLGEIMHIASVTGATNSLDASKTARDEYGDDAGEYVRSNDLNRKIYNSANLKTMQELDI